MVHTPILPKKINRSDLISHRIIYDEQHREVHSQNVFLNQIIYGNLTENIAKTIIYSDFYSRFYNKKSKIPLFITPDNSSLLHQNNSFFFSQYQKSYKDINTSLSALSINAQTYHVFSADTMSSLHKHDNHLHKDHRIGFRSDVVYYNI